MQETPEKAVDIAVIGAGIVGIATAYYLAAVNKQRSVLLIDYRQAMSYTSAQSGDNYRNWWPHPTMTAFTNRSIELMQGLADQTQNVFCMNQRGYALATRSDDIQDFVSSLQPGTDIDVINGRRRVQKSFPALSDDIEHVIHIRRAGDLDGRQLGDYMLQRFREAGGRRLQGELIGVETGSPHVLNLAAGQARRTIDAQVVVNAAGPFVNDVAAMLGVELPVTNIYQQKIAFDDRLGAIPRAMPFSIDLDEKTLEWSDEEQALLNEDPELAWLAGKLPAGTHCRPDGGARATRIKLGWAYNRRPSQPQRELENEGAIDPQFPEIVLRGAARMLPALKAYVETPPGDFIHYGGYYTMTRENWPLIGPMGPADTYVAGAMSGFGSMSACAAGELCASWICGDKLPEYARDLSLLRYEDAEQIERLQARADRGIL